VCYLAELPQSHYGAGPNIVITSIISSKVSDGSGRLASVGNSSYRNNSLLQVFFFDAF